MQSFDIFFHLPAWYLLLCTIFAAGGAWLLYRFPLFGEEDRLWVRRFLGAFRFAFLFILSALLLEPLIRHERTEIEKPVVALLVDDSESIRLQKDSADIKAKLAQAIEQLRSGLGSTHQVQVFLAADGISEGKSPDLNAPATNLSKALKDLDNQFENRNLGATILFSDGLYNQGSNPIYVMRKSSAPIYTVGLGDTTEQRDLWIEEVRQNRLAYLSNRFPLSIRCKANDLKGQNTRLRIKSGEQLLHEETLQINEEVWSKTLDVSLKAEHAGMQRFDISLEVLPGEHSRLNNHKTIYMEVVDGRNKILILAEAPHPDLAALKEAIESYDKYKAEVVLSWNLGPVNWKDVNLLILHSLPSLRFPIVDYLEDAEKNSVPVLYIVGESTNLNQIRTWSRGIYVQSNLSASNDALAAFNPNFQLFTLEDATLSALKRFPPLSSPFGNYSPVPDNRVLFKQKIGMVESGDPLLAFSDDAGQKTGVLFGEGYWRWRLYDYELNANHNASDEIIQKVAQYLVAKKDKRPFRVIPVKQRFDENERLLFRAELYNASFQLVNEPDVFLKVRNSQGKEFTYQFTRDQDAYSLDAGYLEPGDYTFSSTTQFDGNQYHSDGLFSVSPLQLEALNTRADFDLLRQLADKNGGQFYTDGQLQKLISQIDENEAIHSISYMKSNLEDIIRLPWLFWLLVVFISVEWFVRKYFGAY
ncbi:MAG: hypothetical protein GC180_09545 [Bacteroidetes bacterium]|nr:hypothetical protein [Bacteroidota bacterium]